MLSRLFSRSRPTTTAATFRPAMECLEGRTVPAVLNFVTTAKSGTTLTVTANNPGGENNNNLIEIYGGETPGTIDVWSQNVRGLTTFTGITNIVVNLKDGEDYLSVGDLYLAGNLTISGATGGQYINLGGKGGQELQALQLEGGGLTVAGTTTVTTGAGNDVLYANDVQIGVLIASLGGGDDAVGIDYSTFTNYLQIDTGAGHDEVSLYYSGVDSPGIPPIIPSIRVTLGTGDDYFSAYAYAAGLVVVDGGTGSDYSRAWIDCPAAFYLNFENDRK